MKTKDKLSHFYVHSKPQQRHLPHDKQLSFYYNEINFLILTPRGEYTSPLYSPPVTPRHWKLWKYF